MNNKIWSITAPCGVLVDGRSISVSSVERQVVRQPPINTLATHQAGVIATHSEIRKESPARNANVTKWYENTSFLYWGLVYMASCVKLFSQFNS